MAAMFNLDKTRLVVFLIISLVAAVLSAYAIKRSITHFPAQVVVNYEQINSDIITVYYDVGYGFRQSERGLVHVDNYPSTDIVDENSRAKQVQQISIDLPLKKVHSLRFDLDSKDKLKQSISIKQLCLQARQNQQCWSAQELYNAFEPLNNIDQHRFENDVLNIQTNGADPHFTFSLPIASAHQTIAKIAIIFYLLAIVVFAIAFFFLFIFTQKIAFPWAKSRFNQQLNNQFSMSIGVFSAAIALLSIALSGAWMIAYQAGLFASLLLVLGLLFLIVLPTSSMMVRKPFFSGFKIDASIFSGLFISLIACLPLFLFFAATWSQEFPHLGDHEYHLWGNRVSYQAIKHNDVVIMLSVALAVFGYLLGLMKWFVPIIAILLVSVGLLHNFPNHIIDSVQGIFARYPGGARILAHPFVHLSYLFDWHFPLNTGRVVNVLSVPIWLLILRPLVIGRLPTIAVLPFIFVFFWQAEIVYLFSTAYLDIWSVIFVLLAMEKLIVSQTNTSQTNKDSLDDNGYLKACLLLSIACAFKEPAIFIIPWFWLAGWSLSTVANKSKDQDKGKRKDKDKSAIFIRLYHAIIVGFASVLPFLVYYSVRKSYGVSRYDVRAFEYFLTDDWFAEMATRIGFHFGVMGSLLLGLLIVLWVIVLSSSMWRAQRWMMLCILGAIVSQIVLFNWDAGGVSFTGYLRFYLPTLVLFFAPIFLIFSSREPLARYFSPMLIGFCVIALLANMPLLYKAAKQLEEPDSVRNFNEHYDAPIYLPIRSLIEKAEQAGVLQGENKAIHINHVSGWNQPAFAYPDLLKKYKLNMNKALKCQCSLESPSVLAPFVYIAGLNKDLPEKTIAEIDANPQRQSNYAKRWRKVNGMRDSCLVQLQQFCQHYYQEQTSDGIVVGAMGVGAMGVGVKK